MNRSREACHSWHACQSQGGLRPALKAPTNPLCLFLPPPPLGGRLRLRAAWMTYPTCHQMKKAWLSGSPNNARKTSKSHQSPLRRQYFPPILSRLSCPSQTPKTSLSHTSSPFLPTKMESPRVGSSLPTVLPWMAKGLPLVTEAMLSYQGRHLHSN